MCADCDAEIARRTCATFAKHFLAIADALKVAATSASQAYLRDWYAGALEDIAPLAETIAKYGPAVHNERSEVRYVSSSDSAASGDEISGLKVDRGQPCHVPLEVRGTGPAGHGAAGDP